MRTDARSLIKALRAAGKALQKEPQGDKRYESLLAGFKKLYGGDEETTLYQVDRYLRVLGQFVDRFGGGPVGIIRIPSRICIIGAHTDYLTDPTRYLLGHVIAFANPRRDMLVVIRPNREGNFRLSSTNERFKDKRFHISDFTESVTRLSASRPGDDRKAKANRRVLKNTRISNPREFWLAYLDLLEAERKIKRKLEHSSKNWENYVKASVYWYLVRRAHRCSTSLSDTSLNGFDMAVCSDIPLAGGASSSSALVVASDIAVRLADGPQELDSRFKMEAAMHTPLGEWFVGTRGGSMDQITIALGEPGKALSMSFGPFRVEKIRIPAKGYRWVTVYTHPHGGGSQIETGYNERSAASLYVIKESIEKTLEDKPRLKEKWRRIRKAAEEEDARALERLTPDMEKIIALLPEYVTLKQIRELIPADIYEEMVTRYASLFRLPMQKRLTVKRWARHHFEEVKGSLATVKLLKEAHEAERRGDLSALSEKMKKVGEKITESGKRLRDLYGLSTPDLERVMEVALATEGVLGAYIHGGGFGGSALVLVEKDSVERLIENETERYYRRRGRGHKEPTRDDMIVTDPGEGLSLVDFPC